MTSNASQDSKNQIIVNNCTDRSASFSVTPVTQAPVAGDLPPRAYAALVVPSAARYLVTIGDGEVDIGPGSACVSAVQGHEELQVTKALD